MYPIAAGLQVIHQLAVAKEHDDGEQVFGDELLAGLPGPIPLERTISGGARGLVVDQDLGSIPGEIGDLLEPQ